MKFKRNRKLPPALPDDDRKSRTYFLAAFFQSALVSKSTERVGSPLLNTSFFCNTWFEFAGLISLPRNIGWTAANNLPSGRRLQQSTSKDSVRRFFAGRPAQTAHRWCAALPGSRAFVRAAGDVSQSSDYPGALHRKLFRDFLQSMLSAFLGKEELQAEDSRAMWSPIF